MNNNVERPTPINREQALNIQRKQRSPPVGIGTSQLLIHQSDEIYRVDIFS